jgi:hypothetical protein
MSEFTDISVKLITAIVARLRSDVALNAVINGVYLTAPNGIAADYIMVRTPLLQNRSISSNKVLAAVINVDIYTKANHVVKANNVADKVIDLLGSNINIAPYKIMNWRFVEMRLVGRKIGDLYQHSVSFNCLIN